MSRLQPVELDLAAVYAFPTKDGGCQLVDARNFAEHPTRKAGVVTCHDGDSFARYFEHHAVDGESYVWVNARSRTIIGVVNGHGPTAAGRGDHVVRLDLKFTPEWQRWTDTDGHLMAPAELAEFIEDHAGQIADPTTLLDSLAWPNVDNNAPHGKFTITCSPYGLTHVTITARMRHRRDDTGLTVGYQLVNPHDMTLTDFRRIADTIEHAVGDHYVYEGTP